MALYSPFRSAFWRAVGSWSKRPLNFTLEESSARTLSQIEFATLFCQIKACSNSRPISALRDDPDDLSALIPGHFLIGRHFLISPPEESTLDIDSSRLSRWQQVRAIQIWRSWSSDYLHTLQQRWKWQEDKPDLKVNELVLLKNKLLPPSKWELARIVKVHPGADQHVRVVTLRTAKATLKRSITLIDLSITDNPWRWLLSFIVTHRSIGTVLNAENNCTIYIYIFIFKLLFIFRLTISVRIYI